MDEKDKNEFIEDFKKADGSRKLDLWYYALEQEVIWEQILSEMSTIAKDQKIDKKLDQMMDEELKKMEP